MESVVSSVATTAVTKLTGDIVGNSIDLIEEDDDKYKVIVCKCFILSAILFVVFLGKRYLSHRKGSI